MRKNSRYKHEDILAHIEECTDKTSILVMTQLLGDLEKVQAKNKVYKSEVKRLNKAHIVKNHYLGTQQDWIDRQQGELAELVGELDD